VTRGRVNVHAAVAQEERRMIGDRTKAGLAAAKERAVKLGGPSTACHQRSAPGARRSPGAGHSPGAGRTRRHARSSGSRRAQRARGRNSNRCALVRQDRAPGARTADSLIVKSGSVCRGVAPPGRPPSRGHLAARRNVLPTGLARVRQSRYCAGCRAEGAAVGVGMERH
jgi:hypothetical protein